MADSDKGPLAGSKVMLLPQRPQIDRWLFVERRSLRETSRLCEEELGIKMDRRTIAAYYQGVIRRGGNRELPGLPGVVLADRAVDAVHDMQELTQIARDQLRHRLLDENDQTVKTSDLIAVLNLEQKLYGATNMADFSQTEQRWKKAVAAILRVLEAHVAHDQWVAIQGALFADPDFIAVVGTNEDEG